MPTLTQLKYILAVSKNKHFGRAADDCHVSQPSLSAQVQKLEDELDVVIFDRSKQPVMVTAEGEAVVTQAKKVLQEVARFSDIRSNKGEVSGDFHLGVIPTLSPYVIPLFIESFSKKNPKVNLRISEFQTEELVRKLYDDELDGGLLVTPLNDDRLIERALFREPFLVFCSEDHEMAERKEVKAGDLSRGDIWILNQGHCFRDQVLQICSTADSKHVLENVEFESGSLETIKNLVRKGRGYTLLPKLATQDLLNEEKRNQLKSFSGHVPTREVSLVHSRSFMKDRIITSLCDEISNNLPEDIKNLKRSSTKVISLSKN